MSQPLVSIILPTYNGAKYLAQSLQSCINQSYKNIDIIIVNDCSTDDTLNIAQSFAEKDERVTIITNSINKKLPLSLNTGFEIAKGDYFTWTSDDNYYALTAIETMVDAITSNKCGLVYANYTLIDDNGNVSGTKSFGDINQSFVKWEGCGACFLYKSELHKQLKGYDASAFLIEDYDFFLRASIHTKFCYLNRMDLYFYRHHAGSLTSLYGFYNKDLQKIVIERQLKNLLPVLSKQDHALLFRKFAVYYAVYKNLPQRSGDYIKQLYIVSTSQAFVTTAYIIALKLMLSVKISVYAIVNLVKAIFRS
jgi:glycosyltransferase involved in cell wall biosynthesis